MLKNTMIHNVFIIEYNMIRKIHIPRERAYRRR